MLYEEKKKCFEISLNNVRAFGIRHCSGLAQGDERKSAAVYCNMPSSDSPKMPSICRIQLSVSRSTTSSSSSCNSLMNGSISGRSASQSSPSVPVRSCSHLTAARRIKASSCRINLRRDELSVFWCSGDAAAPARPVMAGMMFNDSLVAGSFENANWFNNGCDMASK